MMRSPARITPRDPVVACAVDAAYAMPLAVMVRSLLANLADDRRLKLFVLDCGLSPATRQRLLRSWGPRVDVSWIEAAARLLENAPTPGHVSRVTYFRMVLPELLPDFLERAIYLDVDLVVLDDIGALWDRDLRGCVCLAAQDAVLPYFDAELGAANFAACRRFLAATRPIPNYAELGLDGRSEYFNGGVLLIDLARWRAEAISERLVRCLEHNLDSLRFWDQYPLNAVLSGSWGKLEPRWNAQIQLHKYPSWQESPYDEDAYRDAISRPGILHYAYKRKPWHFDWPYPGSDVFFRYLDETEWAGWRPRRPWIRTAQWRERSRKLRKRVRKLRQRVFEGRRRRLRTLVERKPSPSAKARRVLAKVLVSALSPRTAYRLTGSIPPRLVSYEPFVTGRYADPVAFEEPPPPTGGENADWPESQAPSFHMAHMVEVEHGIASAVGHVCDRDGYMIHGATQKYRPSADQMRLRRSVTLSAWPVPRRLPRELDTVGVLTVGNQHQLWHWLFDVVPRLELLEQHGPADCPIYVTQRHGFQREGLALFGVRPERILSASGRPIIRARRLIVPCYCVADGHRVPAWVRDVLRARFLPKEAPAREKRRIYVSRGDALTRRVRNEGELLHRLRPLGFERHVLAELPFAAQVRLYRDAEVVIGAHGSGLANLVFCDPGTTVIELLPATSRDFYYRLSRAAGLRYYFVKARSGDGTGMDSAEFATNPDDLLKTLAVAGL